MGDGGIRIFSFDQKPRPARGTAEQARIDLPVRARILVLVMRRLGDVLLTTPLIRTIRRGLPGTSIDVLVFAGTEGIVAGNPDIDEAITLPQQPSVGELLGLIRRLTRRYDLAISTQSGDRPTFLACIAGRQRIGFVGERDRGEWWKRRALSVALTSDPDNHRVPELLRLSDALGLTRQPELVCPVGNDASGFPNLQGRRYAVLHANPMYRFRRWTDDGWRMLARALADRGLRIVVTGSASAEERHYLDGLWNSVAPPVERLDGILDWAQLAAALKRAAVYVGPDTSMTHLAAASGCPTVALYGPASPHRIGPWPVGGMERPWAPAAHIQNRGNVWIVQNPLPCLPCEKLGCEGHYLSHSRCLDELSVAQVMSAVDQALRSSDAPALRHAETTR